MRGEFETFMWLVGLGIAAEAFAHLVSLAVVGLTFMTGALEWK